MAKKSDTYLEIVRGFSVPNSDGEVEEYRTGEVVARPDLAKALGGDDMVAHYESKGRIAPYSGQIANPGGPMPPTTER